ARHDAPVAATHAAPAGALIGRLLHRRRRDAPAGRTLRLACWTRHDAPVAATHAALEGALIGRLLHGRRRDAPAVPSLRLARRATTFWRRCFCDRHAPCRAH